MKLTKKTAAVKKKSAVKPRATKAKTEKAVIYEGSPEVIPFDPKLHGAYYGERRYDVPGVPSYQNPRTMGMITGCGLYTLSSISWLTPKDVPKFKKVLNKTILPAISRRTLLATMGDSYPEAQKALIELGFEEIGSFWNPGHGDGRTYQQHVYLLKADPTKHIF